MDAIRPALQAYRVAAMLMVVILHSSISYMQSRGIVSVWLIYDQAADATCDVIFFFVNALAMPMFFLISGMLAAETFTRRGGRAFAVQRVRRLLIPFLLGVATVVPVLLLVWALGMLISNQITLEDLRRVDLPPAVKIQLFGPAHLWFLEQLLLFSLAYGGIRWLAGNALARVLGRLTGTAVFSSSWLLLIVVPLTTLSLWLDVDSIVRLRSTFVPDPVRLLYNAIFFVTGTQLAGISLVRKHNGVKWLLLSLPVFVVMAILFLGHYQTGSLDGPWLLALTGSAAIFTWLAVRGLLCALIRFCNRPSSWIARLSDASYWTYLIHVPIVGLGQVAFSFMECPAVVKISAITIIAIASSLVTYERLVRGRTIGTLLGETRPAQSSFCPSQIRKVA